MNLHPKELAVTGLFASALLLSLLGEVGIPLALFFTLVLIALSASVLQLRIGLAKDRYYLIGPAFYYFFGILAVSGLRHGPSSLILLPAFIVLSYGLIRSLMIRHQEPLTQLTLQQNVFLVTIWISEFMAVLTLYNLLGGSMAGLIIFTLSAGLIVFLLTQSLFHYVRIAPWRVRNESAIAAWGVTQPLVLFSLWTVSPLMVAGASFLLLYLFWGIVYHSHRKQLTRKILYEYLLMSGIGLAFLLVVTKFSPSL